MRDLTLTSPLPHGLDVSHLQEALNARLREMGSPPLLVDGTYGPISEHEVRSVGYFLGLEDHHPAASMSVQRLIEHPNLRTPAQLLRAGQRRRDRAQHPNQASSPLLAIVEHATRFLGVHESPAGMNTGDPYPSGWERRFGFDGQSWCGAFAGSMVELAGGHVTSRVAYCPYIEADARTRTGGFDRWVSDHQSAGPGWLVLYDWNGDGVNDHVGIVESIHSDHLVAIEGNTGGPAPGWGGMVAREERSYAFTVGYARPRL